MLERDERIPPELLGLNAMDSFYGTTTAARGAMYTTHQGQSPLIEGNESSRIFSGVDLQYADYTFDVRFPVDATVLHILRKYQTGQNIGTIHHNPVTTIIYEDYYSPHKTIGVLHVPEFLSYHQDFGYRLQKTEAFKNLSIHQNYEKDTVLAHSTAVKSDGTYGLGINANAVFLTDPGCIEDGFVWCQEFLEKMAMRTYNKYVANAGRKSFFLNLYGDENRYQPFPNIGQAIRGDGIVMATRELDEDLSPADMTQYALRNVDATFDQAVYGRPGAIVTDINVWHDNRINPSPTPTGMDSQLRMYYDSACMYYRNLLNIYNGLRKRRPEGVEITPEFSQLLKDALLFLPVPENHRKLTRMYRLEQLDEWRVDITCEGLLVPDNGYKSTDFFGGC